MRGMDCRGLGGSEPKEGGGVTKTIKWRVTALIVLNAVVLLGRLWPEGAPPFARAVDLSFPALCLLFLIALRFGKVKSG
jgi:hypothetical protein